MTVLQAIVLGITQGLTEFAPVSSSGHLILVPWLFGWSILNDPNLNKTFDVALHMGTFFGAVAYFWRDIAKYLAAWGRSIARRKVETVDERLAWFLVIGTAPAAVVGALFESQIEEKLGQPWLIATMLAVFGVALYLVDRVASAAKGMEGLRLRDSLIIGSAQAVALQPGVSRAGVTMTAGRWLGMNHESAARFSFLLAIPIIFGAGVFKVPDVLRDGLHTYAAPFFWGFVSSAASGFLVIWGLLGYLRRRDFTVFVIYRLAIAALLFVLIATGVRPPTV